MKSISGQPCRLEARFVIVSSCLFGFNIWLFIYSLRHYNDLLFYSFIFNLKMNFKVTKDIYDL
ncbi:hypothetical protein SAMN05421820_1119 [Pedobacter steynii]|uniref:Uncharacterized protein n=1 Tax=Pedobacter steynii TaxID=430522 RepID=A0A1H0G1D1_9SPHI|nr:hypothetical protein SAMN05421820_1119 [Pedobacter steynii]